MPASANALFPIPGSKSISRRGQNTMKRLLTISRALSACALALLMGWLATPEVGAVVGLAAQDKPQGQPKLSEDEAKALQKINAAPNTAEKTKQVVEFLKKFKKTTQRAKLAEFLANQINNEKDANVKLQTAQQFSAAFDQPGEADLVKPALIDAYVNQGKFDEAYSEGQKYLAAHPDDVFVHAQLGFAGAQQVQKNGPNWKHTKAATQHAVQAVEMLEGDKKPEKTDAQFWTNYRNSWLPRLYQATGLIFYLTEDKVKAKDYLEKSAGLDPYDVTTLAMLGDIANTEYNDLAKKYQTERKAEQLDKALEKMDEIIDWYARAVAAAEGKAEMQQMRQQVLDQLKQYYAFRHEGKTDGLDALINKYKKPAQ
jgi:tetratricopeptide (TPR) repeat protein